MKMKFACEERRKDLENLYICAQGKKKKEMEKEMEKEIEKFNDTPIKERLLLYATMVERIKKGQFEKALGARKGYFARPNLISVKILASAAEAFPDLSMNWVLTGRGEMLMKDSSKEGVCMGASVNEAMHEGIQREYMDFLKSTVVALRAENTRLLDLLEKKSD